MAKAIPTKPRPLHELDDSQACSLGNGDYTGLAYYRDASGHVQLKRMSLGRHLNSVEAGFRDAQNVMASQGIPASSSAFFALRTCHDHPPREDVQERVGGIIVVPELLTQLEVSRREIAINDKGIGTLAVRGASVPVVLLPSAHTDRMARLSVTRAIDGLYVAHPSADEPPELIQNNGSRISQNGL